MKDKILVILIIPTLVFGGAYWYFKGGDVGNIFTGGDDNNKEEEPPFTNPDLKARYKDDELGFFVDYPEGFTVTPTVEENTKLLLFSKNDSKESFQIFITPYDEPGPILPERIQIDQPKMTIKSPQNVVLPGLPEDDASRALIFFSSDPDIGDVREVWFVYGEHLYQASTYDEYDELLSKVMATFKFR